MVLELLRQIVEKMDIKIALIIVAVLIGVLFFFSFLIILLLVITSITLSFVLGRMHLRNIGIELVAFTAIITGYIYGATAGIMVGLVLILFHLVLASFLGIYIVWIIPEYTLLGYFASMMSLQPISALGITLIVAINVINVAITAVIYRENVAKHLPWVITNVLFNVLLFFFIAPIIMQAL